MPQLLASLEQELETLQKSAGPDSLIVQELRQQLASLRAASPKSACSETDEKIVVPAHFSH